MPNPRAKIESLDAENLRIARDMLTRQDLHPPGSIGREWAEKVVLAQPWGDVAEDGRC